MLAQLNLTLRFFVIFSLACVLPNAFAAKSTVDWQQVNSNTLQAPPKAPELIAKPSSFIPAPPSFDAKAYILMDANSGYVIAEKNSDVRMSPASLTKIMTLYLIADALRAEKIHLTDMITISEKAWRTGGSRMFIKVGSSVSIQNLISGIATASGNDATIAMAEHLAGSEESFASLMNQAAHTLGMNNSNFTDSSGLPNNAHYSTARDLAILSKAWITNFPEYYPWFKEKWITYNGIKQPNRNRLLWRDPSVDGIKTGHTDDAGYCLVTSAVRNNGMRLISVILGATNDEARNKNSLMLLNYGFRFFESRKIFAANTSLASSRVWLGKDKTTDLGLKNDLYITLPAGQHAKIKANAEISKHLKAPVTKGQVCGTINVMLDDKIITSQPLVALKDNGRGNFIFAIYDYVIMLFRHLW